MKKYFICLIAVALALFTVSCEEADDNKLSSAQSCLDGLDESVGPVILAEKAAACAAKLGGMTSPESYVIRCAVDFIVGGITSVELTNAFDLYDKASTNEKTAILMGALAQSATTSAEALANAATTVADCKKSQVPGLEYIASLSQIGTIMTIRGGSSTPTTFLTACQVPDTCEDDIIGAAVISMASAYCIGDTANSQACIEINSAISQGGGDPAAVAIALYERLQ